MSDLFRTTVGRTLVAPGKAVKHLAGTLLLCMAAGFGTFANVRTEPNQADAAQPLPLSQLQAFTEAFYQIKSNYVDEVDDAKLLEAAIQGMVASLDSHSRYLDEQEYARFNDNNQGQYAGIGVNVTDHKRGIQIERVIKASPAERAGIQRGMIITAIDHTPLRHVSSKDALKLLVGEVDTRLTLQIESAKNGQTREYSLTRQVIHVDSVRSQRLDEDTGYIALWQFTFQSPAEFRQAVETLNQHQRLKKLIIDLRDNPGGIMDSAVAIADLFIPEGTLLQATGRAADANEIYPASEDTPFKALELVVIINAQSASASEILAAALQDHQRALILGESSYGKGTIQSIYALNPTVGVKITTARYLSPNGHVIQGVGVHPDQPFVSPGNRDSAANLPENPAQDKFLRSVRFLADPQLRQAYNWLHQSSQH